jgi:hypothetical protein
MFSRRLIGWSMSSSVKTEDVARALRMAVGRQAAASSRTTPTRCTPGSQSSPHSLVNQDLGSPRDLG